MQISLFDLALPLILIAVSSALLALTAFWPFTKNRFVALLLAVGFYFAIRGRVDMILQPVWNLFRSVGFISKIIDFLGGYNLIIFVVLFVAIVYYLFIKVDGLMKSRKLNLDVFFRGAVIAILVTFSIQLYSVLRIAVLEWPQFFYRPAALFEQGANMNPDDKPDIYYIVLDRYTNENILRDRFGFDNSDFANFLRDNGFSIDPNAHANYPNTASSVSSTLRANYHGDLTQLFAKSSLQTYAPYFNSALYSPVAKELKKLGYQYYNLGSYYDVSSKAPLADNDYKSGAHLNIFGRIYALNTFEKKELANSIYWKTIVHGIKIGNFTIISYGGMNQKDQSLSSISKLKELADQTPGSRFIFSHILVPHNPYYFNADGSLSKTTGINNIGKPVKEKYVGQVEFINSQMKEIVSTALQKSDGQAIIIIQSDEGPYPARDNMLSAGAEAPSAEMTLAEKEQLSSENLQMKYGILAAYHIPKATSDDLSSGGSSVNVFRLVLNSYFGYNLPYLPKCSYSFDGSIFKFKNINEALTGSANPDCPSDGVFNAQ